MTKENQDFVGHLAELRKRIMLTLFAFLLAFCFAFIFVKDIYRWLVRDLDQKLAILGPSDIVWVYFMIAGVGAIALTIPVAASQAWLFVKPALREREQKATVIYIPVMSLLFVAGISFGYFIIYPMVLGFLNGMAHDFETVYTAEKYFRFMIHMTVPFGFLFEMPAVTLFLSKLGIVNPARLAKARKPAYFVLSIVAVTITPPDIISDILVIIPLFALYEISVSISKLVYRQKLQNKASADA